MSESFWKVAKALIVFMVIGLIPIAVIMTLLLTKYELQLEYRKTEQGHNWVLRGAPQQCSSQPAAPSPTTPKSAK